MTDRASYPWSEGDALFASELNAAIANMGVPLDGSPVTFTGPLYYTATGGNTPRSAQDRAADVVNAVALTVSGTSLQFGSDGVTPGNNALNGALQSVQGWSRVLSDAEMQQVTA